MVKKHCFCNWLWKIGVLFSFLKLWMWRILWCWYTVYISFNELIFERLTCPYFLANFVFIFVNLNWIRFNLKETLYRSTQRSIFRSVSNLTSFVEKRIHLQLKAVKYYSFMLKLYYLFASQERPKIVASKMLPERIDTLECLTPLWKSTKMSIFPYFSPNLPNKCLISCNQSNL